MGQTALGRRRPAYIRKPVLRPLSDPTQPVEGARVGIASGKPEESPFVVEPLKKLPASFSDGIVTMVDEKRCASC